MNKTNASDILSANVLTDALLVQTQSFMSEYAHDEQRYFDAMRRLKAQLGDQASPGVEDEMAAIRRQTTSNLLYCAMLGFKANLDHNADPVSSFLDAEPEEYLREEEAHALPEYQSAQQLRDQFAAQLSQEQRLIYEDVIDYVALLETVVPKLAHYYGYLLANDVLPRMIPGYCADAVYTEQYRAMLEKYFGKALLPATA